MTIMTEENKKQEEQLNEEQLDEVTGGGRFVPITDPPKWLLAWWWGLDSVS